MKAVTHKTHNYSAALERRAVSLASGLCGETETESRFWVAVCTAQTSERFGCINVLKSSGPNCHFGGLKTFDPFCFCSWFRQIKAAAGKTYFRWTKQKLWSSFTAPNAFVQAAVMHMVSLHVGVVASSFTVIQSDSPVMPKDRFTTHFNALGKKD